MIERASGSGRRNPASDLSGLRLLSQIVGVKIQDSGDFLHIYDPITFKTIYPFY